ncbi:MAG: molybdopterin dinucleotide binding domain-containing protein [Candidatus Thorarchaeota archaeon]
MALGDFLFPHIEVELVIAHSFEADIAGTGDKLSQGYMDVAARVALNKGDLQKLGLQDGKHVILKSKAGAVVVAAFGSEKVAEGLAVMPHGPWALALVAVPSDDSPPVLHGVTIAATRTNDEITRPESLLAP